MVDKGATAEDIKAKAAELTGGYSEWVLAH